MSALSETASGSQSATPATSATSGPSRPKKSMSELLAKVTSDVPRQKLSEKDVDDFFRAELWRPEQKSFREQVLDRAADLAPSSSAAPPSPVRTPPRRGRPPAAETPPPLPRPGRPNQGKDGKMSAVPPVDRKRKSEAQPPTKAKVAKAGSASSETSPVASRRHTVKSPEMPKSILKKPSPKNQKPKKVIEKPNTLQKSTQRQITKLQATGALTRVPVDVFAEVHVKPEPQENGKHGRPQRRRMPPLQSWRNERVIYKRTARSAGPSVVAVELDMARAPDVKLPALQLPLPDIEASEFAGISTQRMGSKIYALPCTARAGPCTIELCGPGLIHVLDGSLRFAKETDKREKLADVGTSICLKDSESHLLAPADKDGEDSGVRFLWVEIR